MRGRGGRPVVPDSQLLDSLNVGQVRRVSPVDVSPSMRSTTLTPSPRERAVPRRRKPSSISGPELRRALEEHDFRPGATAKYFGISLTSLFKLMDAHPEIRKARDLGAAEIQKALEEAGGQPGLAAACLRVSERGLKLRMKALGLSDS